MIEFFMTHIEVVGVILLTLGVAFILLQQRRSPQSTAAWILFLVVMPYVAAPLFLALGFRKQGKRYEPIIFTQKEAPQTPVHALDEMFQSFNLPPALEAQRLNLHDTPQTAYAAAMEVIESATQTIDVLFYIISDDDTGNHVVDALTEKARNGVKVRLLMDRLVYLFLFF